MTRATETPDTGAYNRPAQIQKPADWVDNGSGGNANAGQWTTVRGGGPIPLMVALHSGKFGRGARLTFQYGQLYATADHYAEVKYTSDVTISAGYRLVINNRVFRILGAIDEDMRNVNTIMPCIEEQAKGSV